MKKCVAAVLACLMLTGCGFCAGVVDEDKVVAEANKVLKALYMDRDFKGAYDMCGDLLKRMVMSEDLEKNVLAMESYAGKVKLFKPVSYAPTQQGITVFYTAINERGVSYHKVNLAGNAMQGYKVVGVYVNDHPEFIEYKKSTVVLGSESI